MAHDVGVIPATQKALERAGLSKDDIDVFEVNEAFGSVVLAWMRAIQPDPIRVNPNGAAGLFARIHCLIAAQVAPWLMDTRWARRAPSS